MSSCWVDFHGSKISFSTLLIPSWSSSHMTASSPPCHCHLRSDTSHYLVKVGTWSITMISNLSSGISLQRSYSQPTCPPSSLLIFKKYKWTYFQSAVATHSKSHAPDLAATQNDVSENLNPDILLPEPLSSQIPLLSQQGSFDSPILDISSVLWPLVLVYVAWVFCMVISALLSQALKFLVFLFFFILHKE